MFEIAVEITFTAAHALTIAGLREPVHNHEWRVRAVLAGDDLDDDGLVCDFHELEAALRAIVAPWRDRCLNDVEPFRRVNPSAERVAERIAEELRHWLAESTQVRARVARVAVAEAPGCEAICIPRHSRASIEPISAREHP